jgi:hypothetical protein
MRTRHKTLEQKVWDPSAVVRAVDERTSGIPDLLDHLAVIAAEGPGREGLEDARRKFAAFSQAWQAIRTQLARGEGRTS